jgi:hypothetical protein
MVLLEFLVDFAKFLEVLDFDALFFHSFGERKVFFRQFFDDVFCPEGIVELLLEILDQGFRFSELSGNVFESFYTSTRPPKRKGVLEGGNL